MFKYNLLSLLVCFLFISACQKSNVQPDIATNRIIIPKTDEDVAGSTFQTLTENLTPPLVSPGANYNILAIYDGNLDTDPSDEQVLVAIPLNDESTPLQLMIASTNPIRNEYAIIWRQPLSTRTMAGLSLRTDDITGDGRDDIIITGFDSDGRHITEVFASPKRSDITDFRQVFGLSVNGNIDIVPEERSVEYFSGLDGGVPFRIIVQKQDPDSDSRMNLLETEWIWNAQQFAYESGASRFIQAETISDVRIGAVWVGDVSVYQDFLQGIWYKNDGESAFKDMLFFDSDKKEIAFYDGSIQEIFNWVTPKRTTAKRLYNKLNNTVIPSITDDLRISAESWNRIQVSRAQTERWNGEYHRLDSMFQDTLDDRIRLKNIISNQDFSGMWKSYDGIEMKIDPPNLNWTVDGINRVGTVSFITIKSDLILQIQFLKDNGAFDETVNWLAEYNEDSDTHRIIRSLTLMPVELSADSLYAQENNTIHLEQIEVLLTSN